MPIRYTCNYLSNVKEFEQYKQCIQCEQCKLCKQCKRGATFISDGIFFHKRYALRTLRFMHICVTKDENPTLKERKAAKPTAELGFPSVTIYSPGLNMNLDLDLHDGEVRNERWREQHLRNNPGDGLATEHRRRQSGKKQRCGRIRVG